VNTRQKDAMTQQRILLAVTGASGPQYALALARALSGREGVELHLILSEAAKKVIALEADFGPDELLALAHRSYSEKDIAAGPASGSWRHAGMIVCPCSMASLAAIAQGIGTNLIHRAADVTLKEGKRLVLVTRETPLSLIHIKNMLAAKEAGATIVPASPGFYHKPKSIEDLVNHLAGRVLDQLDVSHNLFTRWGE
jgi:4-hydroxy-3-polyprenylbenzoate decarboxylase